MKKVKLGFDLILLGDPTSGKDTQAALLMKKYNLLPVESGKHWRAELKKKTPEAKLLAKTMAKGLPTPVKLMRKFLIQSLKKRQKSKDIIFIGTPKLKPEAQLLSKLLKQDNQDFFVLYLQIPISEILKRTKSRARLKSEDDAVLKRIDWTKNQIGKTVEYYKKLHKLKFINSTPPIPKVASAIDKILKKEYAKRLENSS